MGEKILYKVTIEETVSQAFDVYADETEDIAEVIKRKYNNGELLLAPGNLVSKQMCIMNTLNNACSEWTEFK